MESSWKGCIKGPADVICMSSWHKKTSIKQCFKLSRNSFQFLLPVLAFNVRQEQLVDLLPNSLQWLFKFPHLFFFGALEYDFVRWVFFRPCVLAIDELDYGMMFGSIWCRPIWEVSATFESYWSAHGVIGAIIWGVIVKGLMLKVFYWSTGHSSKRSFML